MDRSGLAFSSEAMTKPSLLRARIHTYTSLVGMFVLHWCDWFVVMVQVAFALRLSSAEQALQAAAPAIAWAGCPFKPFRSAFLCISQGGSHPPDLTAMMSRMQRVDTRNTPLFYGLSVVRFAQHCANSLITPHTHTLANYVAGIGHYYRWLWL